MSYLELGQERPLYEIMYCVFQKGCIQETWGHLVRPSAAIWLSLISVFLLWSEIFVGKLCYFKWIIKRINYYYLKIILTPPPKKKTFEKKNKGIDLLIPWEVCWFLYWKQYSVMCKHQPFLEKKTLLTSCGAQDVWSIYAGLSFLWGGLAVKIIYFKLISIWLLWEGQGEHHYQTKRTDGS